MTASRRYTLAITSLLVFHEGLITAAIGPVLPELADKTHASLTSLGTLFSAIFLGALLAQFFSGPVGDRHGRKPVMLAGAAMMIAGTLGILFSPALPLALAAAFVNGLGYGSLGISANVLIAENFPDRSVSALNLVNLFYSLGAFSGPALVSLAIGAWGGGLAALWVACGTLGLLLPLLVLMKETRLGRLAQPPKGALGKPGAAASVYASPLLWLMCIFLFVYVGLENGMGAWTTTFMSRSTTLQLELAALVTSGFWLALSGGRLLSTVLGGRVTPWLVVSACLGGALAGGVLLAAGTGSVLLATGGVLLMGLSFGAIYPTSMAVTTAAFAHNPGQAVSLAASVGSLGAMLMPPLQGYLLENAGPQASALLMLGGAVVMVGLFVPIRARSSQ